ncbi:MAG TPA: DUF3179 domain-containing (seleno)protein [Ktedonobacterales bacterium]|jgi:hypothetical protein
MSRHNSAFYATQTGMVINPARAHPQIVGADVVFPPFDVTFYQDLTVALAKRLVDPQTKLMVFEVGQHRLALVLKQMAYHHVAQGELDGQAWVAFFCVSCNMGTSLVPIVGGRVHRFRLTGIYNAMSMMSDDETGSVWEHVTGECIRGPLQGAQLQTRPAQYLTAAQLVESMPDAKIAISKTSWRSRLLDAFLLRRMLSSTGYMPGAFRLSMTQRDTRLPELELGLGIWSDGHARFYPMKAIKSQNNALVDTLNEQQMVIYIDPASGAPGAHRSTAQIHGWDGATLTLDSGERIRNGYVLNAASERHPIDRPNQQFTRWYGFSYMFPACEIFSRDN